MKPTLALQLFRNMGVRYTSYRLFHEFQKRAGILKKKHPVHPLKKEFISLASFRTLNDFGLIEARNNLKTEKKPSKKLEDTARRILEGEMIFYNNIWRNLPDDYDWITNPETGFQYDINKHWTEINDFDPTVGDIKDVWEKSRFSWVLHLIRYDYHCHQDSSEFVFAQIEDWIEKNPVNQGPNWKCSQETALRILNWTYALSYYRESSALTEARWKKIQHVIYWSLHHIFYNINFSRIAVRNNHAITETLCLALSELLFPFIPETKTWARKGRKWFEQEIEYQIYEDGTFLQFSMNYHRVVVQLLSLGISLTERKQKPFSNVVYERAYKSLNFLYQCVQEENGFVPNYGNNDGALFFPLSDRDYRDFRPQLNTLHYTLTGVFLYEDNQLKEDLCLKKNPDSKHLQAISKQFGSLSFPIGGFYLLREKKCFTFIRCGKHKDRPGQADNLHLDVWVEGDNVLRDSGTYKYNTSNELQNYFSGTLGHNTVSINGYSQMLKGSRFIWYYWTQARMAGWTETSDAYIFKGAISAFRHLDPKIVHVREIAKKKSQSYWEVKDTIEGIKKENLQQWHMGESVSVDNFYATSEGRDLKPSSIPSYNSTYYGAKENGKGIGFPFSKKISTTFKM